MIVSPPLTAQAEPRGAAFQISGHAQIAALVIAWFILSFGAAFRWFGLGRDYLEYLHYYETIPPYLFTSGTRFEPGFHFVAWFFRTYLNLDYGYLVLFISGTALAIKFYLFRKYLKYPLLAAATYVAVFYPIHEYTQVRAGIALALAYLAIHLLLEKRYIFGALGFVLAYTFHTSVVVLPFAFLVSRYVRGNLAVFVIAAGTALLFYVSDQVRVLIVSLFSGSNPLLQAYVDNRTFESVSLFSVNNLLLMAALAAAVAGGWFRFSRYHATFLTLALGAIVAIAVFASAPMIATRIKEVLFVSVIFLMYRSPITLRTLPPVALLWANALLLAYLAFREGLIIL